MLYEKKGNLFLNEKKIGTIDYYQGENYFNSITDAFKNFEKPKDIKYMFIEHMKIDEKFQGQGYGTQLIKYFFELKDIQVIQGISMEESLPFWEDIGAIFYETCERCNEFNCERHPEAKGEIDIDDCDERTEYNFILIKKDFFDTIDAKEYHLIDIFKEIKNSSNLKIEHAWRRVLRIAEKHGNQVLEFPFEHVKAIKQGCGHYEILQSPRGNFEGYENRICTSCTLDDKNDADVKVFFEGKKATLINETSTTCTIFIDGLPKEVSKENIQLDI